MKPFADTIVAVRAECRRDPSFCSTCLRIAACCIGIGVFVAFLAQAEPPATKSRARVVRSAEVTVCVPYDNNGTELCE